MCRDATLTVPTGTRRSAPLAVHITHSKSRSSLEKLLLTIINDIYILMVILRILLSMLILFYFDHYASSFFVLGFMGISNGLANVLGSSTWAEIYGVKYIGSIKALTTAMMVFSTAFGTAIFGIIIDSGYSIEIIALISSTYIIVANVLIIIFRSQIKPISIK